jgi:general secretion pathway protein L
MDLRQPSQHCAAEALEGNNMTTVARAVSHFFSWWLAELTACIPGRVRALLTYTPSVLVITPGDGVADVVLYRRGQANRLGEVPLTTQSASRRALLDLLGAKSLHHYTAFVNVPAGHVLRRSVALPLEAAENLREVLAFEMDRNTPFKASEVAYDYRVVTTDETARKLNIDLAVVPRARVQQAASIADLLGLAASRIGISDDGPKWERVFNFRPYEESDGRPSAPRALLIGLAITAALLGVIAWYLPLYFDHRALAAYESRLEEARTRALETENLKRRLTTAMDVSRFLVGRRAATPTVTSLFADVTERLPDDTWLTHLQLQDGKLTLTGFSPSAAALIALLEASPILSGVRFGSPVTPDSHVDGESFNILARAALDRGS